MEKSIEKAGILIEALPYIQSFQNKIVVVKLGGSTMSVSGCDEGVLRDIVFMEAVKMKPVLIHGGGQAISRRMKEAGISPRFIDGLRVTDERTIGIVQEVLSEINKELVEKIIALKGRARGLNGVEKSVIKASKYLPVVEGSGGESQTVDIGFVGEVARVEPEAVLRITRRETIPVIAPLGRGEDGRDYNINGDMAAGAIAGALKAEKLVFLTDVEGIMRRGEDDEKPQLLSSLRQADIKNLMKEGVLEGGMIPKVKAGLQALADGVKKIHIIDGRIKHSLLLEIFTDKGIGTEIVS